MCVAFRKHTLLPLDVPSCASNAPVLHRCYQRHGISRLPKLDDKQQKKKFKKYPYIRVQIISNRNVACANFTATNNLLGSNGKGRCYSLTGFIRFIRLSSHVLRTSLAHACS